MSPLSPKNQTDSGISGMNLPKNYRHDYKKNYQKDEVKSISSSTLKPNPSAK